MATDIEPRVRLVDIPVAGELIYGVGRSRAFELARDGYFGELVAAGVRRRKVNLDVVERLVGGVGDA